ncbi:MAG TPA: hypothetical protein VF160_01740 [Candidatus Dormibacteraeota bacterium]
MARFVTAFAVAACGLLMFANGASASTVVGQAQDGATCNGGAGMDTVQSASAGPSYTVPAGNWQITDWSTQASAAVDGNLALEVWRPTATAGTYTLVGISDPQTVVAGSGLNTFTLAQPIPVQPGDLLGLRITGFAGCSTFTANFIGDAYMEALNTPSPTAGSTTAFPFAIHGFELNVAATLTEAAPPPPPTPSTKSDCMDGGWQQVSDASGTPFKNEGDCVSYVATQGSNSAG